MEIINGVKMYDTQDVKRILSIGEVAYRRLRQKGLLRSITLGGCLYTSEEALQEYLKGKTLPTPKDSK